MTEGDSNKGDHGGSAYARGLDRRSLYWLLTSDREDLPNKASEIPGQIDVSDIEKIHDDILTNGDELESDVSPLHAELTSIADKGLGPSVDTRDTTAEPLLNKRLETLSEHRLHWFAIDIQLRPQRFEKKVTDLFESCVDTYNYAQSDRRRIAALRALIHLLRSGGIHTNKKLINKFENLATNSSGETASHPEEAALLNTLENDFTTLSASDYLLPSVEDEDLEFEWPPVPDNPTQESQSDSGSLWMNTVDSREDSDSKDMSGLVPPSVLGSNDSNRFAPGPQRDVHRTWPLIPISRDSSDFKDASPRITRGDVDWSNASIGKEHNKLDWPNELAKSDVWSDGSSNNESEYSCWETALQSREFWKNIQRDLSSTNIKTVDGIDDRLESRLTQEIDSPTIQDIYNLTPVRMRDIPELEKKRTRKILQSPLQAVLNRMLEGSFGVCDRERDINRDGEDNLSQQVLEWLCYAQRKHDGIESNIRNSLWTVYCRSDNSDPPAEVSTIFRLVARIAAATEAHTTATARAVDSFVRSLCCQKPGWLLYSDTDSNDPDTSGHKTEPDELLSQLADTSPGAVERITEGTWLDNGEPISEIWSVIKNSDDNEVRQAALNAVAICHNSRSICDDHNTASHSYDSQQARADKRQDILYGVLLDAKRDGLDEESPLVSSLKKVFKYDPYLSVLEDSIIST